MVHSSRTRIAKILSRRRLLELVAIAVLVAGCGFSGWYVWYSRHSDDAALDQVDLSNDPPLQQTGIEGDGWTTTTESGRSAYSVTFPDGWHVLRDTNSDSFMIGGEQQPTAKLGTPATITDTQFGSDGPVVLFIAVYGGQPAVRGTASDFLLANGKDNPIMGKKYIYEYPADDLSGIGDQRIKGDRDYAYVFALGNGKYLHVSYSVYGSDPRNQIATIDALVQTIRVPK